VFFVHNAPPKVNTSGKVIFDVESEGQPGISSSLVTDAIGGPATIWKLNQDLELNAALVVESEIEEELDCRPLFDPKEFNEMN